jgi:hypothetical protein
VINNSYCLLLFVTFYEISTDDIGIGIPRMKRVFGMVLINRLMTLECRFMDWIEIKLERHEQDKIGIMMLRVEESDDEAEEEIGEEESDDEESDDEE